MGDDSLGLLDRFRKQKPLRDTLKDRWKSRSDGSISDSWRADQAVWMAGNSWFNSFLENVEMRLSLSLGRKLAHAASESEEFFLSQNKRRNLGSNMEKWAGIEVDRNSRGLGDFEIINQSSDTASVIVNHFSSGPMEAGIVASSWEFAKRRRHKFRWSESGRVLLVNLEADEINVPLPSECMPNWPENIPAVAPADYVNWNDARELEMGGWELDGERKIMISRDLILRFEEFSLHNIQSLKDSRAKDYVWEGVNGKRALWWTALADTSRHLFMETKRHVMISDARDWITNSIRNLSTSGLGIISEPKLDLDKGGLEAKLIGTFHPAISGGIILGCWERSTGSKGRICLNILDGELRVKVSPARSSVLTTE